jgi:predicted phosphate transport protein (TIGR00153 family)
MSIDYILQFFVPKDNKFFPLFEKDSANLVEVSKVLYEMLKTSSPEKRNELILEIERLEHVGDQTTHDIFNELSSTFITPFDREDIHALAAAIDDIVDYIHGSAKRISLYRVQTITPAMIKLAELILQGSEELHRAIVELRNTKNFQSIREACIRINSIENHADDIFDTAVGRLFEDETNAVEIIKNKEVLQNLEIATDKCEDAANVLQSIIVKYS